MEGVTGPCLTMSLTLDVTRLGVPIQGDGNDRHTVSPSRYLIAMPPERSTRAGILPSSPRLDGGSRDAEIGFEPWSFSFYASDFNDNPKHFETCFRTLKAFNVCTSKQYNSSGLAHYQSLLALSQHSLTMCFRFTTPFSELIKCDKKAIALEILYDVMKLRRAKQWQKVLEELMMLFVELCVELRKNVHFRKVIYQYKNISVMENTASLEQVIRYYLTLIKNRTEEAQRESKTAVMDIEDLDVLETPESLMLNAVSFEGSQDRSARTILMPWLKFLWDGYRLVLDLLRSSAKLEHLYHEIANDTYEFCIKYGRKAEFRKLSELLRIHTQKVQNQTQTNAPNLVNLNNPETQILHFETRLRQLDCAMELEMYNEAFKAVEDIWGFILMSKKVSSPVLLTNYYSKSAELFLRCGCHLYHAAALHKVMFLYRDHKKNITREELSTLGSRVLCATLAIPLPNSKLNSDKFLLSGEYNMIKQKTLAGLLGLFQVPTRQSLIHDLVRHKVQTMVPSELADLYQVLEADFQPLTLWERSQPALGLIQNTPELNVYSSQLHEVIVSKTVLQLSQVYQTIRFEELMKLCPFMDSISLERCVIELIHNLELPIRLNHRLQAIMFDEFTDLGISQCDYGGQLVSQSTHVNAPDKLSRQLTVFAQVMQQITEMLDENQSMPSYRRALVKEYRNNKERFHKELLERRDYIEYRKEEVERIHRERDQYFMDEEARRQAEYEQRLQHEERNLLKEAEERERRKTEDEQARLKRRIARGNYNLLMEHKIGVKMELTEEQLDQFDADKILEKKALEVKKKRKEAAEKAKALAKKLDYFVRAVRLEEIPLLQAAIEPEARTARELYERSVTELEEHSKAEHARQLKERNRLIRMKPDIQRIVTKLKEARDTRYKTRLAEWEEQCDRVRAQRLAERKAKQEAEEAAEAERRAREEEEARKAAEAIAEIERAKQEKSVGVLVVSQSTYTYHTTKGSLMPHRPSHGVASRKQFEICCIQQGGFQLRSCGDAEAAAAGYAGVDIVLNDRTETLIAASVRFVWQHLVTSDAVDVTYMCERSGGQQQNPSSMAASHFDKTPRRGPGDFGSQSGSFSSWSNRSPQKKYQEIALVRALAIVEPAMRDPASVTRTFPPSSIAQFVTEAHKPSHQGTFQSSRLEGLQNPCCRRDKEQDALRRSNIIFRYMLFTCKLTSRAAECAIFDMLFVNQEEVLKAVGSSTYLGSCFSPEGNVSTEFSALIWKARTFANLLHWWRQKGIVGSQGSCVPGYNKRCIVRLRNIWVLIMMRMVGRKFGTNASNALYAITTCQHAFGAIDDAMLPWALTSIGILTPAAKRFSNHKNNKAFVYAGPTNQLCDVHASTHVDNTEDAASVDLRDRLKKVNNGTPSTKRGCCAMSLLPASSSSKFCGCNNFTHLFSLLFCSRLCTLRVDVEATKHWLFDWQFPLNDKTYFDVSFLGDSAKACVVHGENEPEDIARGDAKKDFSTQISSTVLIAPSEIDSEGIDVLRMIWCNFSLINRISFQILYVAYPRQILVYANEVFYSGPAAERKEQNRPGKLGRKPRPCVSVREFTDSRIDTQDRGFRPSFPGIRLTIGVIHHKAVIVITVVVDTHLDYLSSLQQAPPIHDNLIQRIMTARHTHNCIHYSLPSLRINCTSQPNHLKHDVRYGAVQKPKYGSAMMTQHCHPQFDSTPATNPFRLSTVPFRPLGPLPANTNKPMLNSQCKLMIMPARSYYPPVVNEHYYYLTICECRVHTKGRDDFGQFTQKQLHLFLLFEDENDVCMLHIDKAFLNYLKTGVQKTLIIPNGQFRFEDGELVLSDNEPNLEGKGESEDASNSRKSRRKQTFERRNIKKVREDALSEEAKAAQKAEMERRKRLGKDHIDHTKFSNIEFLLNDGLASADSCVPVEVGENNVPLLSREVEADETSAKRLKTAAPECLTQMDGSLDSRLSEVVIKPEDETCRMNVTDDCTVEELVGAEESSTDVSNTKPCDSTHRSASLSSSASANLFGSWRAGQSRDDAILLGDSDDEQEKHMASDVIELSDGEEEPEEPEVETEICELQDAANLMDERGRVVLNPNRDSETECEICLPPQIARVIKPHQVSGIRFLYDNVIENQQRFETTDGFGCILAHSMGLGKTIQIIGFLDTIFRYCNVKRVLVIVPINTIQNWQAEFELWLPTDKLKQSRLWSKVTSDSVAVTTADTNTVMSSGEVTEESTYDQHTFSELFSEHRGQVDGTTEKLMEQSFGSTETMPPCKSEEFEKQNDIEQRGNLRSFKLFVVRDVVKTMTQRHQIVNQWFEEGGVLLLGYEMFRLLLNQKRGVTKAEIRAFSRRKKKTICLDLIEEERREKMLADFHAALIDPGPQLVICDEGHRIKNSEASISKALKAIKTRRRVVLTGYPLQNNLMEYWCMVDFVRPSYLGTKQEFTNMFQRPIENGQCIDSTPEDRKVMQGRAHVLHDLLSGFVQRRSHVVLKASLPPKTEIVLLIKLSPLQRTLYAAFMKSLNSSGPLGWAQVNTLKTYAMCCKIWNHPDILWRAMEEHKEAMDFDIEDPSSNSASSTAYSNRSLTRSATTSALSRRSSSQLSLSSSEQSTAAEKSPAETPPASSTLNWPPYATVQRSPNTAFTPPNPFFPTLPHSLPNRLTSPPSVPAYLYNQTQQNAPTVPPPGTYDWASDADLWGPDYKPGNVEHSGKIILFLSLLEGCVLAGDKILVFTQSLYTLDLLERILRRLPLPVQKLSEAATSSACDGQPDAPVSKFECTEDCDTDAKMYAASECRSIKATVTGPDESSESANSVSLPETDHPMEPVSTKNRDICEEQANSLDDSQFLESVLGHSGPVVSDEPTPSGVSEATEHQQTTQREPLSMTFEQVKEEEQPEETLRSLHYRLASRLGRSNKPSVWTKNVHYF
ncbi:translation initiation factor 3 subunit A, partial [Clonorchis sinensis]